MPSKNPKYRVMIAAGGTGGHVYPAISIADALGIKMKQIDIAFVGTKNHMEWTAVPKAGYQIYPIWVSGLQRRFTFLNAVSVKIDGVTNSIFLVVEGVLNLPS